MCCRICNAAVVGKGLSVSEQLVGTLRAASGGHISFAAIADAARCVPTISCFCVCKAFAMRIGITNSESTVERDCKSRSTGGYGVVSLFSLLCSRLPDGMLKGLRHVPET